MPLYRRLPKRGFNKWQRKDWNELSLGRLQQAIDAGKIDAGKLIDVAVLVEAGVLRRPKDGVRLLGSGEIKAKVEITVNHATAKAREAIERAGGSVSVIEPKLLPADEEKRKKSAAKKVASGKGKSGE